MAELKIPNEVFVAYYEKGFADGSLAVTSEIRNRVIDEILNLQKHNHYDVYGDLMYQSVKVDDIKQLKEKNNG